MRQAEAPFRGSRRLTADRDIAEQNNNRLRSGKVPGANRLVALLLYSDGRIATDTASSLTPLIWSTNGLRRNLVLHGLANAVAIGGAAEGLWLQGMAVLHHVDPAARGQADGVDAGLRRALEMWQSRQRCLPSARVRAASAVWPRQAVCRASVIPVDGKAASSPPDASLMRSGAVSAARSCSMCHLNLSQPLGSSAAQAGADAEQDQGEQQRRAHDQVHRDHDDRKP